MNMINVIEKEILDKLGYVAWSCFVQADYHPVVISAIKENLKNLSWKIENKISHEYGYSDFSSLAFDELVDKAIKEIYNL